MKTDYGWYNGGNGTNSSGFSGLPGGYRANDASFANGLLRLLVEFLAPRWLDATTRMSTAAATIHRSSVPMDTVLA